MLLPLIWLLPCIVLAQNTSTYTNIDVRKCASISADEESGSASWRCNGITGYKVIVSEGDLRQTIDVIAPNRKKHELNLWGVVSGGFSSLGDKIEWRMKRVGGRPTPVAMIVRFKASEDPDDSSKITSYLVVAKVTPSQICVVDKIAPGANQNVLAQRSADDASTKPCLE